MLHAFSIWVRSRRELERVAIAAGIGTVLAWLTYEIIYLINPFEPRATTSWTAAFLIGIFRQHHLHRTLAFYKSTRSYSGSLSREAAAALLILIIGIFLNFWLTNHWDIHHRAAWAICLVSVAMLEYGLMKFFVFRVPEPESWE